MIATVGGFFISMYTASNPTAWTCARLPWSNRPRGIQIRRGLGWGGAGGGAVLPVFSSWAQGWEGWETWLDEPLD